MAEAPIRHQIKTERLAYWFFRLNGCLCLENFLIHHEIQGREGTEVDLLTVRLPYRQELAMSGRPMKDHPVFDTEKIDLAIAEITIGTCKLNGPWTDPKLRNMVRVLYAVGAFPQDEVETVATALYEDQYFEDETFRCRLFALGMERNQDLGPTVVQLEWQEILVFIHRRFTTYGKYKTQHRQWDQAGEYLFNTAIHHRRNEEAFVRHIMDQLIA